MNWPPLYIVDIIGQVVAAADAVLFPVLNKHILYTYGRSVQITSKLQELNDGIQTDTRNGKFPLLALFQDFPESFVSTGYYATVRFPKIAIATLTQSTDDVPKRYTQTFKPILYPIYQEFLRQIARHPNIVINDPGAIPHIKWDRPGSQPEKGNLNEYIDAIEIQDLQLTFKQIKICKQT